MFVLVGVLMGMLVRMFLGPMLVLMDMHVLVLMLVLYRPGAPFMLVSLQFDLFFLLGSVLMLMGFIIVH